MKLQNMPLTKHEESILRLVHPSKRAKYRAQMESTGFVSLYSDPHADVFIDRIESMRFDPVDVMVDNRNWAIDKMGTEDNYKQLFRNSIPGRKVEFVIMDSGVPDHKDFENANKGGIYYPGEEFADRNGHATAVGSYVASTNPDTCGIYKWCEGTEPTVWAWYSGVLSSRGSGGFSLIARRCRELVPRVKENLENDTLTIVNLSLGANGSTPLDLSNALADLRDAGAIVVGAAGNDGMGRVSAPANDDSVLATSAFDKDGGLADYTNYGEGIYHTAGGTHIYSAAPNDKYVTISGTSMSTPISATFLAMIWKTRNDVKTADDVLEMALRVYVDAGDKGYDTEFGNGYGIIPALLELPEFEDDDDGPNVPTPKRVIKNRRVSTQVTTELLFKWETRDGKYSGEFVLSEIDFTGYSTDTYAKIGEDIYSQILNLANTGLVIPEIEDAGYAARMLGLLIHKALPRYTITSMRLAAEGHTIKIDKNIPKWMITFYKAEKKGDEMTITSISRRAEKFIFKAILKK